ncbi:MAG TPA: ATP-binding protein [Chryseosolibacter sp.]
MIILVAGLPGSGKTFFAERLAQELDLVYINSDQVRLALNASGKYSPAERLLVYKQMLVQTTEAIEENRDIMVDATFFHHTMREMFIRLADAYNVPIHVIEVVADEKLIRQRLQTPRKYSEADFAVYEKVREDFEGITMPHLILESTNNNVDEMLKTAMRYINSDGKRS